MLALIHLARTIGSRWVVVGYRLGVLRSVRALRAADRAAHVRMRSALWPDADVAELDAEFDEMLVDPDQVIFVAEREGGGLCGMVERTAAHWCARPLHRLDRRSAAQ